MGNSSDWLTALLERPEDGSAGQEPLSWLSDLSEPDSGFIGGLPFGQSSVEPETEPLPAEPDGPSEEGTGDKLTDIPHETLDESQQLVGEADPASTPDPVVEAFARGEEAGRQAAMAEVEAKSQQKLALRQTFRALDQAAMDALAGELSETVIALCAQTLADYEPDAEKLAERCIAAAKRLGAGTNGAVLHLCPGDLALLDDEALGDWKVVGDPSVERGGLRFESEDGSVSDEPSDWRRAIAAAIRG